jgi:hypothetical protein
MRRIAALVLAVAFPGGSVLGQSLGELAESTRKKRKGGAHVYTDDDLKKRAPDAQASPQAPGGTPAATAGASGGGEASEGSGEGGEGGEGSGRSGDRGDQSYWREQAAAHRAAMERAEKRIEAAQLRINALMSDAVPTNVGDPFQQQTLEAERVKARKELEDAQKELELAEDAFHVFEEEARRKSVPPGWLEER